MKIRLYSILNLALLCGSALGAPEFSYESTEEIPPHILTVIEPMFSNAAGIARELPPARGNPLRSRVKRRVHFLLTVSSNELAKKYGRTDVYGADAFTFTDCDVETAEELNTIVFLLVDRICIDDSGRPRPDAFIRMITAIGHELYGNVPDHLKFKPGQSFQETYETKQKDETTAHRGGVAFLNRLIQSDLSQGLDEKHLKEALLTRRRGSQTMGRRDCLRRGRRILPAAD